MGQYQEWLLAQEIDRRLKTEVGSLETEILALKKRIIALEQTAPETENVILQALLAHLRTQEQHLDAAGKQESTEAQPAGWSALPKLETPQVAVAEATPSLTGKYSQREHLSDDMLAFFEEQRQTTPNFSLWRQAEPNHEDEEHPVDPETQRLNENIQRWFDRWHREITNMKQPEVHNGQ